MRKKDHGKKSERIWGKHCPPAVRMINAPDAKIRPAMPLYICIHNNLLIIYCFQELFKIFRRFLRIPEAVTGD